MKTTETALALVAMIGAVGMEATAEAQHYGPGDRVGPGYERGGGTSQIWGDGDFNMSFGGRGRGYGAGDGYGRGRSYGYGRSYRRGYRAPGYGYAYEFEYHYGGPYGYGAPSRYAPPPGYGYGGYPPAAPPAPPAR